MANAAPPPEPASTSATAAMTFVDLSDINGLFIR
jgi:hypothetical protein